MQITAEYLADVRSRAEQQRLRLVSELQQTVGAIGMVDAMIARLELPEQPPKDAKMRKGQ